jgi:hypothetical protein
MSLTTKINWTEAQKDFLSDPTLRYKDIAEKYAVSLTAVKQRGANEGWHELRQDLSKKTIQQVETKLIDRNSEINERHATVFRNLQQLAGTKLTIAYRQIERLVKEYGIDNLSIYDHRMISQRDLKDLVEAYTGAINGERVTVGLPTSIARKEVSARNKTDLFIDDNYEEYLSLLADSLAALEEV